MEVAPMSPKVVWSTVLVDDGEPYVAISGGILTPLWCVDNLD